MPRTARPAYTPVSVPQELVEDVDRLISAGLFGYRSRAEFIMEAVREKLTKTLELKSLLAGLRERKD